MSDAPSRLDEAIKQIRLAGREIDDPDARDDLQQAIGLVEGVQDIINDPTDDE